MVDQADGAYQHRPWELTSQTLDVLRREWADQMPQWQTPVPPQPDAYAMIPPRFGYRTEELGLDDIMTNTMTRLQGSHIGDSMMTDWSGGRGSYQGSSRDSIQVLGL